MRFLLLGGVEVHAGGVPLPSGSAKQLAVLAALLVHANQPLTAETLVDRVWGDAAHDGARRALHTYIARIRRLLAEPDLVPAGRVLRRGSGYLIETDLDQVDLHRYRRLVERAAQPAVADETRAALLREAFALWQGEPLAGVPGDWAARTRAGWQREHHDAVIAWADVELRLGNPGAVIAPLSELADRHPLVEPLAAALIRALHAANRSAEALDRYAVTRQHLAEALGVDPGPALRAVHQAILRGDGRPPSSPATPAQLPLDVRGFTGRASHLAALDAALATAGDEPNTVVVCAVSGMAGVGKTALAVHWAHRARRHFPDGQLYVNLRGFDPTGPPLRPTEALRGFLEAFDVPPHRVPASLESQIGLYRSLVDGRRVLVIVDNAGSAEQVRPLLPGTPTAMVLVTSRNTLPGLVAGEGAQPLVVDVLSPSEARELLTRRLDRERVEADPTAVDEIVAACGRLPLAVAILAARAATQPSAPLRTLADELRAARRGLDAFAGDDPATDVRAVFSWSYRVLPPGAAALFRLAGLHPGPDFTAPAAASLVDVPVEAARELLTRLTGAGLLSEHRPGRYAFHDLVRGYAAEQVEHDDGAARDAAVSRLLGFYLHTAYAADRTLYPHRDPVPLTAPSPRPAPVPAGREAALSWCADEHDVLLNAVRQAAEAGLDDLAWQLAWAMTTYLDLQGHWPDWVRTQELALTSATRAGDRSGAAFSYRNIGLALAQLGRYEQAHAKLDTALRAYRDLRDDAGQAHTHNARARIFGRQGAHRAALAETQHAVRLFDRAAQPVMQARALNNAGWYQALLGEYESALASCLAALDIHHRAADRYGEANTWDSLGYIHYGLGDHSEAVDSYRTAIGLWREVGDRYNEADTLTRLGDALRAGGDPDAARAAWRSALAILEHLGHPDQDAVRTKLSGS
ncbi:AfsR/SARP family transcriptional regulator [Asanoa iriomotensis]|uniref:SARP family transcriptional regulator n=1 Tax=Asanoa iriomotensis TaxID=234613 RepID=A0ABQ4C0Y9_9ACTN|nr:BTAD domain-containing putative transcriptional regulator [Asanoa iriomotensis]GIF56449.1 SARP family transcriptional regulator [Asanoa iriomotensis]